MAHDVVFTHETADRFRDEGREELAQIVERVVADGARNDTNPHSLYALSPARDETRRTIRLDAPIRHITTGPGSGFVQRQRYVSEQALQTAAGKTTRELLEADGQ